MTPPLQLWGGVEGSVVQVAGAWRDQMRERRGRHEAGTWDASANPPRPARLAAMAHLARTGRFHGPALAQAGWWRRHDRLHHPAARRA